MSKTTAGVWLMLGLLLLAACRATAANLLVDAGFEFGQAQGSFRQSAIYGAWTASSASGPALLGMPNGVMPALEGVGAMHIGTARQAGSVKQSFTTTLGQSYWVRFWVIGYNGEAGSGTVRVYNASESDLFEPFSSPGANRWKLNQFKFTASGTLTTLEFQNVPTKATTIDHASVTPVASGFGTSPEIETYYTDRLTQLWSDAGSGADQDGSFWSPSIPPGQSINAFGHVAISGYAQPSGMVLGKALTPTAFAFPVGFSFIWNDDGSGADREGSAWEPVPPAGYVSLGSVFRDGTAFPGTPPPINSVVCVRDDLVVAGRIGDSVWDDTGSGSGADFSSWKIDAPEGAIAIGAFIGINSHSKPTGPVYCLKASAVATPAAPSQATLEQLITTFGPRILFHPADAFLPDDPAVILDHPDTRLQWMTVVNESSNPGFSQTLLGEKPTSSATLLDDVQAALTHALATNSDFRYLLKYSLSLAAGDIGRAKAYIRVQPLQGTLTELQFWIFYPWNSAGKSRLTVGSVYDVSWDPTGTMGRHFSDWENVRVRVTNKNPWTPGIYSLVNVVLSRHSSEEEVAASDPRLKFVANHPIIYAAKGSHAHYLSAGKNYYERFGSIDLGVGTLAVDGYDLTADGGQALNTSEPDKHILVSSAWPGLATTTPDWCFFGGQWGEYLLNDFTTTIPIPLPLVDDYTYTVYEVGNGKPGLLRRREWAVARPENANLGSLRTSAGAVSPSFNPAVTDYSLVVASNVTQITLTPQSADYNATNKVRFNGNTVASASGKHLGKASPALSLIPGENVISIVVDSTVEGAVSATKTYTLTVTRAASTGASSIANGLQAYWNFDGNLLDSSHTFHGTANGTSPVAFPDGKAGFGKALQLDGTDQFVEITGGEPDDLAFASGSVSIAGWFKVDSFDTDWQALVAKGEGANWRVAHRANEAGIAYAGGLTDTPSGKAVDDGAWHHFVAISDAAGAAFGTALYLDGVRDTITPGTPVLAANGRRVMIGANPEAPEREWNGQIDDLAIWNRVLTAEEISSLYAGGAGKPVSGFLPSSNADLANLVPSAGSLSPAFASGTTGYNLSVPNATSAITFIPTAAQANASIDLSYDISGTQVLFLPLASGTATQLINLGVGKNYIAVRVVAQNGTTTKAYIITVTRDAGGTGGSTLASGLQAYWGFDGNLLDSVSVFHGTANGTSPIAFPDGKAGFGKALQLDGTDQFVEITGGQPDDLAFASGSVSIAGWFKVDSFDTDWQALVAKGEGSSWRVAHRANEAGIAYAGGLTDTPSGKAVDDGAWHHFVAITDAAGAAFGTALYLDGVRDTITPGTPVLAANGRRVMIGANPEAPEREWNGQIDDLAIWNRVLTAEEISSLYAGGAGKPVSAFLPPPPLSSNADLAGLVPSAGNLSPAFASGTTAYTVSVPNAVGSITLTSTAAQANATISILGIPVASGEGLEFGIAPGSNPTDVVVTAQDGTVKSYTVTVIRAPQANVAPVAIPQTVQVESGTSAAITLAGSDADGNALTYTVITLPTLGTLSGTAPALTYRPTTPGTAEDSFTFKVNDGTEDSPAATVTIHITTGPSLLADVTRPGDVILSLNGTDKSPPTEQVANAIDDSPATKYLNFGEGSAGVSPFRGITGFTVTPGLGASVVSGLGLTSANDSPDRDPASYKLEGSNNGATFALIAQGEVPPFSGRFTRQELPFANALSYNIYRLTFPTVFNAAAANAMQIAEVELIGYPISDVSNLRIEIVNGQILIQFRGTLKAARDVTGPFLPVAGPEASPVTIRPDATTQFYIAE